MGTSAPARAKASATARPIPQPPPIITLATLEPAGAAVGLLAVVGLGPRITGPPAVLDLLTLTRIAGASAAGSRSGSPPVDRREVLVDEADR